MEPQDIVVAALGVDQMAKAVPAHGQHGDRLHRQRPPLEVVRELPGDEARVGEPAIDMRREFLEFASEQAGKARLEPFGSLDHEQIVDHLNDAYVGAPLEREQRRHILLLPPEVAGVEQDIAGAGCRGRLQRLQRPRPAPREEPFHRRVEPEHAQEDIGNMIVARVGQQRPKACQAHALGENRPKARNRRGSMSGPLEIPQKRGIDAVEGIAAQHPRYEFHPSAVVLCKRRYQLLGHALDARRMAEIGIPMDHAGDVKQDPAPPFLSAVTVAAVGGWLLVQGQISDREDHAVPAFLPSIRLPVNRQRIPSQSVSPNAFKTFQR